MPMPEPQPSDPQAKEPNKSGGCPEPTTAIPDPQVDAFCMEDPPIPDPKVDAFCMEDPRKDGPPIGIVAFYFPGKDEPWDQACHLQY